MSKEISPVMNFPEVLIKYVGNRAVVSRMDMNDYKHPERAGHTDVYYGFLFTFRLLLAVLWVAKPYTGRKWRREYKAYLELISKR